MSDLKSLRTRQQALREVLEARARPVSLASDVERLNEAIGRIERSLAQSPLRIDLVYPVQSPEIDHIGFERRGPDWRLTASVSDGPDFRTLGLSEMSLVQKAEVAKLLPAFIQSYLEERARRGRLVAEANDAVQKALKMLEGA